MVCRYLATISQGTRVADGNDSSTKNRNSSLASLEKPYRSPWRSKTSSHKTVCRYIWAAGKTQYVQGGSMGHRNQTASHNGCQDNEISNYISRCCKESLLVVHYIAFHGLEPFSRQKGRSYEEFFINPFAGFSYVVMLIYLVWKVWRVKKELFEAIQQCDFKSQWKQHEITCWKTNCRKTHTAKPPKAVWFHCFFIQSACTVSTSINICATYTSTLKKDGV